MKRLFLLLFVLCALATFAHATDVTIGATTIPGFNPSGLPADVTVTPTTVTLNSPTVTSASKFAPWVGLGGFRIAINGVAYTVAYVSSASSLTLTVNYAGADSSSATIIWYKYVELRVYPDSAFQPAGKTYIVQPGTPGSGAWYRRVAVSILNEFPGVNNAYIASITLDATTDSLTNQSARYYAAFYRPGGSFIQVYDCFDSFSLPPTGASTWPDICLFNQRQVIVQNDTVYTKAQTDAMRTGCTTGQSLYYAVTGLKPDCLNVGTGLQITGNTISATAGSSYQTVASGGTPLTQRPVLNFIGSSLPCADNAGASRTDCTADSDLNALASNATNGFWVRTGAGTGSARTLQQPAAGFTITNPAGAAGDPAFALANDLGALEGLSGTGAAFRTGVDTWSLATGASTDGTNVTFGSNNLRATSPRITTAINDSNGNEVIRTPATPSAANDITITNSPAGAGNFPTIASSGDDAAVSLGINTKSNGDILLSTNNILRIAIAGNSANTFFGDGVTSTTPDDYTISATGGQGTNIGGATLEIVGGKGTGNAAPGFVALRYPLTTASGTTLQSLSSNRFPISTHYYTSTSSGTAVANTLTETSIFTGASFAAGSTLTIEGGSTRAGTAFKIRAYGTFNTTGTPTIRFRVKLGSVTVADTGAVTSGNNSAGLFFIDCIVHVNAVGASGLARAVYEQRLTTAVTNSVTPIFVVGAAGEPTVDFTANQVLDITAQWGTASASNNLQLLSASVERIR